MAQRTVLLIDYEPRSIEDTRRPLLEAGFRVEVAQDGVSGLEAFHRLAPDLVVVEAMLPKKHGFDVCQEIKKSDSGKTTPVVITTGVYRGRKYRNQALRNFGCDEYLEKPFTDDALLAACNRFIHEEAVAAPVSQSESAEAAAPAPATSRGGLADLEQLTEEEIADRLDSLLADFGRAVDEAHPAPPTEHVEASAAAAEPVPEEAETTPSEVEHDEVADPPSVADPRPAPAAVEAVGARPVRSQVANAVPSKPLANETPTGESTPEPAPRRRWPLALAAVVVVGAGAAVALWTLGRGPMVDEAVPTARADRSAPAAERATPGTPPVFGPTAVDAADPGEAGTPAPGTVEDATSPAETSPARAKPSDAPVDTGAVELRPSGETAGLDGSRVSAAAAEPTRSTPPARETPPRTAESNVTAPREPRKTAVPPTASESAAEIVREEPIEPLPIEATAIEARVVTPPVEVPPAPAVQRGDLVALEQVDRAPEPLSRPMPAYPLQARRMRQQGTVRLSVLVDETGAVTAVEVTEAIPRSVLNDVAVEAVRGWRYRPATKDGVPVKVWKPEAVQFVL